MKQDTPITVLASSPVLSGAKAPVVRQPNVDVWAMASGRLTFGRLTARSAQPADRSFAIKDAAEGPRHVEWYDTWTGQSVGETIAAPVGGRLKLTPPASPKPDLAFKITAE